MIRRALLTTAMRATSLIQPVNDVGRQQGAEEGVHAADFLHPLGDVRGDLESTKEQYFQALPFAAPEVPQKYRRALGVPDQCEAQHNCLHRRWPGSGHSC